MQPADNETRITGHFGMHPWTRAFMTFWFGFLILVGGSVCLGTLTRLLSPSHAPVGTAWVGMVVPPGMLLFRFGLVAFGRYLAREEAGFLTGFLVRTLDAHDHWR